MCKCEQFPVTTSSQRHSNCIYRCNLGRVLPCLQALYAAVQQLVDAAGSAGVQVLCLQEAWTMPFAFCTREREWLEFAEPAETGGSTTMLQTYAQKYNMVIINSILERDEAHGETIWNTAVVIGHNGNVLGKHRKVCRVFQQWSMLLHTLSVVLTLYSAKTLQMVYTTIPECAKISHIGGMHVQLPLLFAEPHTQGWRFQ